MNIDEARAEIESASLPSYIKIKLLIKKEFSKISRNPVIRFNFLALTGQENHYVVTVHAAKLNPRLFLEKVALNRFGPQHGDSALKGLSFRLQDVVFSLQLCGLLTVFRLRQQSPVSMHAMPHEVRRDGARNAVKRERKQKRAKATTFDHIRWLNGND